MTEHGPRTAPARDVPPPRPVPSPASAPAEESGLGRAARALADAVTGLLGGGGAADTAAAGPDTHDAPPPNGSDGDRSRGAALGDLLTAAAPRLPIRDAERLRRAHPGATDAEIADALVARAARLTAGIGAAVGGLAASRWLVPASLLALPLELGAETVLIGTVEVVLVGELHELYGRRPRATPGPGSGPTWRAGRPSARSTAPRRPAWGRCWVAPACRRCAGASPARSRAESPRPRPSCSALRSPEAATGGPRRPSPSGCWPISAAPGRPPGALSAAPSGSREHDARPRG